MRPRSTMQGVKTRETPHRVASRQAENTVPLAQAGFDMSISQQLLPSIRPIGIGNRMKPPSSAPILTVMEDLLTRPAGNLAHLMLTSSTTPLWGGRIR